MKDQELIKQPLYQKQVKNTKRKQNKECYNPLDNLIKYLNIKELLK